MSGHIKRKKKIVLLSIILIALLGAISYHNSLQGKFIWDDKSLVQNNPYIKNWHHLPRLFIENMMAGTGEKCNFYRPFTMLSYAANYFFCGLDVRCYHAVNIFLHIMTALSIFWLVNILSGNSLLSFLASALFVTHPIHTESVAYISARPDILSGLFLFLSFIFYVKCTAGGNIKIYALMLLCFFGGLLSKENSLILPILLLGYHYAFKKRIKFRYFFPVLGMALGYIFLRLTILKFPAPYSSVPVGSAFQRIAGFLAALAGYIKLLLLPSGLHMEYGPGKFSFTEPIVLLGIAVLLLGLASALALRKNNQLSSFSILWFFIAVLPYSNLYPINAYMAEHWLYIPSFGFFFLLANGLNFLFGVKKLKVLTIMGIIGLLAFYATLTVRQNYSWKDPIFFYERTLRYAKPTARLFNNLGNEYTASGEYERAMPLYKKAMAMDRNYADAYNNLGYIYATMRKEDKAIAFFEKAIEINPDYEAAYCNLGSSYARRGDSKKAIAYFKKAIEINPNYALAHNNLAVAYYFDGEYDLAVRHCDMAVNLGCNVHPEILGPLKKYRK